MLLFSRGWLACLGRSFGAGLLVFFTAAKLLAIAPANPPAKPQPANKPPQPAGGPIVVPLLPHEREKPKIPEPEELTIATKDGVQLTCTYFPGTLLKQAACVLMIPGWGGSRKEYEELARAVQKEGHAVITVDPRGHGGSTVRLKENGEEEKLDIAKLRPEIPAMVADDLEAVKLFLVQKNNLGELNIDALLVVGSEFGSILAVEWSLRDWSWPQLGTKRQGQDVKALVLISPPASEQGRPMPNFIKSPIGPLGMLIIAGKNDPKATGDAVRLHKALEKVHPMMPKGAAALPNQTLFLSQPESKLQGTKLLSDPATRPAMVRDVKTFLKARIVDKKFPWAER